MGLGPDLGHWVFLLCHSWSIHQSSPAPFAVLNFGPRRGVPPGVVPSAESLEAQLLGKSLICTSLLEWTMTRPGDSGIKNPEDLDVRRGRC